MVAPNTPSSTFKAKGSDGAEFIGRTLPLGPNGELAAGLGAADGTPINPATKESVDALATIFGALAANPAANTIGARLKLITDALTQQGQYLDGVEGLLTSIAAFALAPALIAGEAHIGQIGGDTIIAAKAFTRPANTIAYDAGDIIANSTTAGSVAAVDLAVGRKNGGTGRVTRARLTRQKAESGQFRIHLFRSAPTTIANGDNGALSSDGAIAYLGGFDVTTDRLFTDGAKGFGVPVTGPYISFECASDSNKIFALLEARGTVTPTAGETFTIALEVDRD